MAKTYKNIPVSEETYIKVAMLAEANGFGERGLGKQVDDWVARELPDCDHKKQAVSIETFQSNDTLPGTLKIRKGWYCKTCNRVYEHVSAKSMIVKEFDPYAAVTS